MKKILATLALVLVALGAQAQNAYPLFAPSNGIMVGNTNTYITTSATGPNVVSLFSGTCNAAAFLRGDASCFDLFGTANTWSQPQTLTFARTNANSPFLLSSTTTAARWNETDGAVDNKQWEWAANAEQFRLGLLTDAGALGGSVFLIDRTGTVVDSIAMAATTVTVNGQNVCRADGTGCPGGITGLANPTASLGLAAVNGAATTAMRSDAAPALSQAIAPTWTNTHIFANNGANATFIGNDPRFNFSESDGALDEKNWIVRSVASGFNVSTASDAAPFSAVNSAITVGRTGTAVGNITLSTPANLLFTGAAFTFNGNPVSTAVGANPSASLGLAAVNGAATTFMRSDAAPALSQGIAPTWTAQHIFSNTSGSGAALLSSTTPLYGWNETDGAVDNRRWRIGPTAETWRLEAVDDAVSAANTAILVDRTGTTIDSVGVTATAFTFNGNPVSTAAGANPTASLGLAAVNGAATTFMRSDGAPALSQAITPTWTNTHTFNNTPVVPNDSWTYAKIQNVSATSRFLGRITAAAGDIEELTGTQATTLLDNFTSVAKGLAPLSGGGTTNFLRADGTWNAPSGASGANPTASVGLAAVNGAAATFLRSDGAPALDQAIAPTWTGAHIFSNAASIKATGTVGTEVESAAPIQVVDETDAPANERSWIQKSVAGDMSFSTATDAAPNTPVNNAITITRTGTTVDTVNLQATTVQINGNPALGVSPAAGTSVGQIVSQQYKGGNTDRSSTTTLAADATLTGLSVPVAGSYLIEGQLCFTAPVAGSGGIKFRYEFTGSISTGLGIYTGNVNGATVSGGGFLALDANQISFATISTTGNCIQFNHTMSATGSGTIDLQWAQNTSDANVTRLSAGSSVIIIRLS